jgi:PAT family beta-lactamase induction signal transducer AmpG
MLGLRLPLYLQPRMLLMFALGFGSGLPLLLTGSTLLAWLVGVGVPTAQLGLFSLCSLPYSLKLLWAPLLDRVAPLPQLGRRRGWMLGAQLLLVAAIAALGSADPVRRPLTTAALALLVAALAATQDIAVDAYRTDLLAPAHAAAGTAVFVFGFRTAMVVAGALALRLFDSLQGDFRRVYFIMAAAMLPAVLATLLAPVEPAPAGAPPAAGFARMLLDPLRDFFQRPGALLILLFVMLYRLSDTLATALITPFLLQVGYTNTQVADATKLFGLLASILGALLGGAVVLRIGLLRSLYGFGVLQAVSNLGYVAIAHRFAHAAASAPRSLPLLYAAVVADNLCTGLAVAAIGGFLITLCNRRFSATQAALLSSASGVLGRLLGGVSGFFVARWGWEAFLLATVALGAPALGLLWRVDRAGALRTLR